MKCPKCASVLIQGEQARYETLVEHVCNPNAIPSEKPTFICSNSACETKEGFWDEDGAYYGFKVLFPQDNSGAIPSFNRKMQVEVYAKGLKKYTTINLYFIKFMLKHLYTASTYGEVLSVKYKLEIWLKDGFCYKLYSPTILLFFYYRTNALRLFENMRKENEKECLKEAFSIYVPSTASKLFLFYMKLFYRKQYQKHFSTRKTKIKKII